MATEYPALNRIHVVGYSANDTDYPILNLVADPRVAGYKVPEDFSACPDKRYPNHIFTGAQPISGDQRVRHTWEILPSPWVPFTRYDDDLGPIQGRRRSVKNEGQEATLAADKRVTYEAREGSALVSIESEESWNAGSGDPNDDTSPFPLKERDFYDDRFGAVSETRQLFAAKGDEQASLVYEAPKIIQTDYEIYNEYLVVKVVRSYTVPCPERIRDVYDPTLGAVQEVSQVILDTKDLEGSIVFNATVGASPDVGTIIETLYQPINTLATERTIRTYKVPAPVRRETVYDPVKGAISRVSAAIKDDGGASSLYISSGVATETRRQPINSIVVDLITETYSVGNSVDTTQTPKLEGQQYEESLDIVFPYEQQAVNAQILNFPIDRKEFQPVDRAHSVKRAYNFDVIEDQLDNFYWECPDIATIKLPNILLSATLFLQIGQGSSNSTSTGNTFYYKSGADSSINGDLTYDIQEGYNGFVPAIRAVFFIKKNDKNNPSDITRDILVKLKQNGVTATVWPYVKTIEHTITMTGGSRSYDESKSASVDFEDIPSTSQSFSQSFSISTNAKPIPPTLHKSITIDVKTDVAESTESTLTEIPPFSLAVSGPETTQTYTYPSSGSISIPATDPPEFPVGKYITAINASPYRFGYTRVETIVVDISKQFTEERKVSSSVIVTEGNQNPSIVLFPVTYTAYVNVPFSLSLSAIWATYFEINNTGAPWITLNNGIISGTPTVVGTYIIPVEASNQFGSAKNSTITIVVIPQE